MFSCKFRFLAHKVSNTPASGSIVRRQLSSNISERYIYPSLVLVQPRKTRPCLTERLLMGRKESNQANKTQPI